MKLRCDLTYVYDKLRGWRRPTVFYDMKVVKDAGVMVPDVDGNKCPGYITVEWELSPRADSNEPNGFSSLTEYPEAISKGNHKEVWAIIKKAYDVNKVPSRWAIRPVLRILELEGWSNLYDIFEIEKNQHGYGFMGGTGCGTKIHLLTFDKVLGVKKGIAEDAFPLGTTAHKKWVLATLLFNYMLGEVKRTREEYKHLRTNLTPEDVYVTLNARPGCQKTVKYVGAKGYAIRAALPDKLTCSKCVKHYHDQHPGGI